MPKVREPSTPEEPLWLPPIRLGGKFVIAIICAAITREPFALAAAFWLAIYGLSTATIAWLRREDVQRHRFTRWDEVVFLFLFALFFMAVHRSGLPE